MDLGLTETAVPVTAGSSGSGNASAMALARGNADVAIRDRNAERLETAREELTGAGSGESSPFRLTSQTPMISTSRSRSHG
jgi:NADP-dependent 3-hydroxy acid dehydrogenase YdfG